MLKQTLALVGITLSLSANAAIVDMGNITRDTTTGLDWLDLTETANRTYLDVFSNFSVGGNLDGWRYASRLEVYELWSNIGVNIGGGSNDGRSFSTDSIEIPNSDSTQISPP